MGVYIPGMEPPKPDEVIRIYNNGEARKCPLFEQKVIEVSVAIPVPEHGRLIDADALAKFIDYGHLNNPNEKLYSGNDIREMIDMMPTITEPVRHGKWELAEDGWYCSACELYPPFDCDPEEKGIPYCPYCGARMDAK